jgi:1-phosphofructokinase
VITTVTANPSLDRTLRLTSFTRGAVHRARSSLVEPSGKGVNVAVALRATGHDVTAVLPIGGPSGLQLTAMLGAAGVPCRAVPIRGAVRSNVSLIEDDGTTSKLNEPGPELSPTEVAALVAAVDAAGSAGEWTAWCGSLPAGFTDAALADAVAAGRAAGRRMALDTSESALIAALDRRAHKLPHLIKPNADELAQLIDRPLHTVGEVATAARVLVERGVDTVLVSLGGDGAVLVDRTVAIHGSAPVAQVVNTAGAGDAFLAGYLAAGDTTADQRLASALRFGAAAVQQSGTLLERPDVTSAVRVRDIDPTVAALALGVRYC